jgi:predicted nucleotidyltransferase
VHIANALGCIDALAFGAECADTGLLLELGELLESDEFREAFRSEPNDSSLGTAAKTEAVFRHVFGKRDALSALREPNNLLGVEYIRALIRSHSDILPLAFPRIGAAHGDTQLDEKKMYSASAARALLLGDKKMQRRALSALPKSSSFVIKREIFDGKIAADNNFLENIYLLHYRLCNQNALVAYDGLEGGLAARFHRAAREACDGGEMFTLIKTKKYTDAYLRRALLSGYLGLTRVELNASPAYTQVLGMNERGEAILASIRKKSRIPVLTKPADYKRLPENARLAAERASRADSLWCALLRQKGRDTDNNRFSPYREDGGNLSSASSHKALDKEKKM